MTQSGNQISRRGFIEGSAAVAAATLMGARASFAQDQVTVAMALGWVPNAQYAGHWVAMENGYFQEEGINPETIPGGPNAPSPLITLAAGNAQIGHANWLPLLEARAQGNDFKMIAANFPVSPLSFLSLAERPIQKPEDLSGARILGQKPSDKQIIETIFTAHGLPIDYEFVPAGFSPEPLLAGDGDAFMCFSTNQPITLEQMGLVQGEDFFVTSLHSMGYVQPGAAFAVDAGYAERNRALLVAYLRAELRGWQANEVDPEIGARLAVEKYGVDLGLDLAQQIRQNELQIPLTRGEDGRLFWVAEHQVTGPMYSIAQQMGVTDLPENPTDVVDMSFLAEALASL